MSDAVYIHLNPVNAMTIALIAIVTYFVCTFAAKAWNNRGSNS